MNMVHTFALLPAWSSVGSLPADIAIIGIPNVTPYRPGEPSHAAQAPTAIRRASGRYGEMLDNFDFDLGGPLLDNRNIGLFDFGDIPGDPSDPEGNRERVTEKIRAIIDLGAVPIVLGGDDSVPIPFFRAYKEHGPITILQVDAHIDWRHEVNGVTEGASSTMRRASEMHWIDRLVQVGMRGVGSARNEEVTAAKAFGAEIVSAKEVHELGVEKILHLVPAGSSCIMTIDCDGLDPSIMPAVRAPVPGGLTYWQVINLLHGLMKKANILGFDLVEFVPEKDPSGLAALTAARIVFNMIGALARSASDTPVLKKV